MGLVGIKSSFLSPWASARSILISNASLFPQSFDSNPSNSGVTSYHIDPCIGQLAAFFDAKGPGTLEREDRLEDWYQDWIDYQASHGIYAALLSPRAYSIKGDHFDLLRLTRFLEIFAYYSPAHCYSLHVSFLGLFPILMSDNEALKREAIQKLETGGLFALGVSEQNHGSDLLANEFTVTPTPPRGYVADGSKYYIGNTNSAYMISVLGKKAAPGAAGTKRAPLIFFALRPQTSPAYRNVAKIRTLGIRTAFVGSFDVKAHALTDEDIISEGREAWDAVFATVNMGKFFLGFGAIGICEQALSRAAGYLKGRVLYGKPVAELPHIRTTTACAYARLLAMKLYAYRALDYVQAASADERRFLLFNAVQKARVSTQGVRVVELLTECVGARGFETQFRFESALREAPMIPVLEGSTHINYGLTAQFVDSYFADAEAAIASPPSLVLNGDQADENPYWFNARDRNPKTVKFADCLKSYEPLRSIPNVAIFVEQIRAFRAFVREAKPSLSATADLAVQIALGRCFSAIVYGQLIAENCVLAGIAASVVSVIFQCLIEDISVEALQLATHFEAHSSHRVNLARIVRTPHTTAADMAHISDLSASLLN